MLHPDFGVCLAWGFTKMGLVARLISSAAAVLLGVVQWYLLLCGWTWINAYSPVAGWLAASGVPDVPLRAVLWPLDLLASIILSLPVAFALLKLRPSRLWLYLLLAIVPGFLWLNRDAFVSSYLGQFAGLLVAGWTQNLLALPLAAWILRTLIGPGVSGDPVRRAREKLHAA